MLNLLAKRQNRFYHDYKVVAAGSAAGIGSSFTTSAGGNGIPSQLKLSHYLVASCNRCDSKAMDRHFHAQFL